MQNSHILFWQKPQNSQNVDFFMPMLAFGIENNKAPHFGVDTGLFLLWVVCVL